MDPAGDLARLTAIRQAVGPNVPIRVDANQGWTPKESVRIIRGMEDASLDIELVEQPTPAHDLDGLAHVTAAVDTTILADESVHTLRDLTGVITARAADAVNIKLAKCGGLRPAQALMALARSHDIAHHCGFHDGRAHRSGRHGLPRDRTRRGHHRGPGCSMVAFGSGQRIAIL